MIESKNSLSPQGDGNAAALHSIDKLREVCKIIKSLLAHFNNIREIKKSLGGTADRSLQVNSAIDICSDLQRIGSVEFSVQEHEENDNSSLTTTFENLRFDGVQTDVDSNLTFNIREGEPRTPDVSVIEVQNRQFFDRVTRAVSFKGLLGSC